MSAAELYASVLPSSAVSARQVALDLVGAVLRRKRPLDEAIEDHPVMPELSARDRAFARLLVTTVLRRLGQIDALISQCLTTPLAARAAVVHDILRLGIAQLLFLRTPQPRSLQRRPAHVRVYRKGWSTQCRRPSLKVRRIEGQVPRASIRRIGCGILTRAYGRSDSRHRRAHLKEAPPRPHCGPRTAGAKASGGAAADRIAAPRAGRLGRGSARLRRGCRWIRMQRPRCRCACLMGLPPRRRRSVRRARR
jgi:transcription termination factor NusB